MMRPLVRWQHFSASNDVIAVNTVLHSYLFLLHSYLFILCVVISIVFVFCFAVFLSLLLLLFTEL